MVVVKLNSAGSYQWHSFYEYYSHSIAVDDSGNVYLSGNSDTTWNGPASATPLHGYRGAMICS